MSQNGRKHDLAVLGQLKGLTWLRPSQLARLLTAMTMREVRRNEIIFDEPGKPHDDIHILMSGTARLGNANGGGTPVLVAIIPPGVILRVPPLPLHVGHHFQCTALTDCRVGRVTAAALVKIALSSTPANFSHVLDALFGRMGTVLVRYPGFLRLALRERLALALLELAAEFGSRNSRGLILSVRPTHQELADLVGASRPKVTAAMTDFARRQMVIREGRALVVATRKLEGSLRSNLNGKMRSDVNGKN